VIVLPPTSEARDMLFSHHPKYLVIGPGPGSPANFPVNQQLIAYLGQTVPTLGICLGHQAIAKTFGGNVVQARYPMHGKSSSITHTGKNLFQNIPSPMTVGRYHSLIVEKSSLPSCLQVTATTESGEIMSLEHSVYPIFGVQFHPDSFLSNFRNEIFMNFLKFKE
jgi:anthranilate synthase component II